DQAKALWSPCEGPEGTETFFIIAALDPERLTAFVKELGDMERIAADAAAAKRASARAASEQARAEAEKRLSELWQLEAMRAREKREALDRTVMACTEDFRLRQAFAMIAAGGPVPARERTPADQHVAGVVHALRGADPSAGGPRGPPAGRAAPRAGEPARRGRARRARPARGRRARRPRPAARARGRDRRRGGRAPRPPPPRPHAR